MSKKIRELNDGNIRLNTLVSSLLAKSDFETISRMELNINNEPNGSIISQRS